MQYSATYLRETVFLHQPRRDSRWRLDVAMLPIALLSQIVRVRTITTEVCMDCLQRDSQDQLVPWQLGTREVNK